MNRIHKIVAAGTATVLAFGIASTAPLAHAVDPINIPHVDAPTQITNDNVVDTVGYDLKSHAENGQTLVDGALTCVVDQPTYSIGYTGKLDMTNVVKAWQLLKENGVATAVEQTNLYRVELNKVINTYKGFAAMVGITINEINWGANSDETANLETLELLASMGPVFENRIPPHLKPRFQQVLNDPEFLASFASEKAAREYWTEQFYRLKVGSEFQISWTIDPSVVDVNIDSWIAQLTESYTAGNTHTTFDEFMRPYNATYDANTGVVTTYYRVKLADTATGYNDPANVSDLNGEGTYNSSNRDVFARELDLAYSGGDHDFTNGNELTHLQITTPPGVLSVAEATFRELDGLSEVGVRQFIANQPKVVGDFRLPISANNDVQQAMNRIWKDTWSIQFNQVVNTTSVSYSTDTDVTVAHRFQSATAGKQLPAEVLAKVPANRTDLTLEAAQSYVPGLAVGTKVETATEIWTFNGWNTASPIQWTTHKAVNAENEVLRTGVTDCKYREFVGDWTVTPKPAKPSVPPVKPAQNKLANTGAVVIPVALIAFSALGAGALLRRRKG